VPACRLAVVAATTLLIGGTAFAQGNTEFQPLQEWQRAVLSESSTKLAGVYSLDPPARIMTPAGQESGASTDVQFWQDQSKHRLSDLVIQLGDTTALQPGVMKVTFESELHFAGGGLEYLQCAQVWQQQEEGWRIVLSARGNLARLPQPLKLDPGLYPESADAKQEIAEVLAHASTAKKRVLLVFGANWCYDCDVLDAAFKHPSIEPLIRNNFEVVHVDIGKADKNLDVCAKYEIPLEKGIPALAVLDANGKLLYSQRGGEFEHARGMEPEDIISFLKRWAPRKKAA
jgi:thioredoxin 1